MNKFLLIVLICYTILLLIEPSLKENFSLKLKEKKKIINDMDDNLLKLFKNAKMSSYTHNKNDLLKTKKYKIAFITYDDRENENFVIQHNVNMNKYCNKYGYEYIYISKYPKKLPIYWIKIFFIQDLLNNYDYVFWLDSDTIINDFNIDIGNILNQYSSSIFIASDNAKYDIANAGLLIVKNSEKGKEFIADCIGDYHSNSNACSHKGKLLGKWAMACYEQGVINKLILEKYYKYTTFIGINMFLCSTVCDKNAFILHYYGMKSNKRRKCFYEINNKSSL